MGGYVFLGGTCLFLHVKVGSFEMESILHNKVSVVGTFPFRMLLVAKNPVSGYI